MGAYTHLCKPVLLSFLPFIQMVLLSDSNYLPPSGVDLLALESEMETGYAYAKKKAEDLRKGRLAAYYEAAADLCVKGKGEGEGEGKATNILNDTETAFDVAFEILRRSELYPKFSPHDPPVSNGDFLR